MTVRERVRTLWRHHTDYTEDLERVIDAFEASDRLEREPFSHAPQPGWSDAAYRLEDGNASRAVIHWPRGYADRAAEGFTALVKVRPDPGLADMYGAEMRDVVDASTEYITSEHGEARPYGAGPSAQDVARFEIPLDPDTETVDAVVTDTEHLLAFYQELR